MPVSKACCDPANSPRLILSTDSDPGAHSKASAYSSRRTATPYVLPSGALPVSAARWHLKARPCPHSPHYSTHLPPASGSMSCIFLQHALCPAASSPSRSSRAAFAVRKTQERCSRRRAASSHHPRRGVRGCTLTVLTVFLNDCCARYRSKRLWVWPP